MVTKEQTGFNLCDAMETTRYVFHTNHNMKKAIKCG